VPRVDDIDAGRVGNVLAAQAAQSLGDGVAASGGGRCLDQVVRRRLETVVVTAA
jgi:hypothetical protein